MEDGFDDGGSEVWTQQRAAHEQAEGDRPEEQVERQIAVGAPYSRGKSCQRLPVMRM